MSEIQHICAEDDDHNHCFKCGKRVIDPKDSDETNEDCPWILYDGKLEFWVNKLIIEETHDAQFFYLCPECVLELFVDLKRGLIK